MSLQPLNSLACMTACVSHAVMLFLGPTVPARCTVHVLKSLHRRSPDCDGEGSDMEDTATSSCSDSSGESAQQSGGNCDSQDQQQQTQTSRQCPVGEDDSINSNQAHNSPSVAFSFGCLPCIAADVVAVWPAVEVAAQ